MCLLVLMCATRYYISYLGKNEERSRVFFSYSPSDHSAISPYIRPHLYPPSLHSPPTINTHSLHSLLICVSLSVMPLPHWHPSNPPTLATLTTRLRQRHTLVHTLYRKGQPTSASDHPPKTFDNKQWTRLKRIDTEIGTGKFDHSSFASAELDLCYASDPLGYGRVRVIPKGLRLGTQRGQERLMKVLGNLVNGVTISPSSSPSQSPLPSSPSASPALSHPPPHTTLSRPPTATTPPTSTKPSPNGMPF